MSKNITERNSKSLNEIFPGITNSPVLSDKEVRAIVKRHQSGDTDAIVELKSCEMRFVASVAKQFLDQGLNQEELLEAGIEGLVVAAEKYDTNTKFKFICYAIWWIKQSIQQAINESQK